MQKKAMRAVMGFILLAGLNVWAGDVHSNGADAPNGAATAQSAPVSTVIRGGTITMIRLGPWVINLPVSFGITLRGDSVTVRPRDAGPARSFVDPARYRRGEN